MEKIIPNFTPIVSKDIIANDFAAAMQGKLEQEKIDAAVAQIKAEMTAYTATVFIGSFMFYIRFKVVIEGGESFTGNAGGLTTPGGGQALGAVLTNDINGLYQNTVSFMFNASSGYLNLLFFDSGSNYLGTFQGGAVSTVNGIGGGSGSWSN